MALSLRCFTFIIRLDKDNSFEEIKLKDIAFIWNILYRYSLELFSKPL